VTLDTSAVRVTISADEPRSVRAVELAAGASSWLRVRTPDGRPLAYGVPSRTSAGRYWLVDQQRCECPDFAYHAGPCAHVLAVRLHCELVRAQSAPRRAGKRLGRDRRSNASREPQSRTGVLGTLWEALGRFDG